MKKSPSAPSVRPSRLSVKKSSSSSASNPQSAIENPQSPRGRPPKGYFFRRYDAGGNTRHASIDDPAHAHDSIWFCVQIHGWRRILNLHTTSLKIARERCRWAAQLITLSDEEKFLKNLSRLGRDAEDRFQALLAARLEHSTKRP